MMGAIVGADIHGYGATSGDVWPDVVQVNATPGDARLRPATE